MKKEEPSASFPILATVSFNDVNSLSESEIGYNKFRIINLKERERNLILASDRLFADNYEPFIDPFFELMWAKERYEYKIYHTFKFLLDSSNQLVIKSDINPKSSFYMMPFIGVIFDDDSSIHFIPFKCFCPRRRQKSAGINPRWLISDNSLSIFHCNITNEQMFLSFQEMKYKKFVLDCSLKESKNFKTGIFYLSIYKYF